MNISSKKSQLIYQNRDQGLNRDKYDRHAAIYPLVILDLKKLPTGTRLSM